MKTVEKELKGPIMCHKKSSIESIHTHCSFREEMYSEGVTGFCQCCTAWLKMKSSLTQQVGPFIHVPYEPSARRRQLFKQRVCIAVERHVLNAFGRRAGRERRAGEHEMLPAKPLFKTDSTADSLHYLQGLYPMRSMSSSGVDSMMSWTSELSSFSGKPVQHTAREFQGENNTEWVNLWAQDQISTIKQIKS